MTKLHSSTLGIESIPLIVSCNLVVVVGPYSVPTTEVVGLSVGDLVGFFYVEEKNCWVRDNILYL